MHCTHATKVGTLRCRFGPLLGTRSRETVVHVHVARGQVLRVLVTEELVRRRCVLEVLLDIGVQILSLQIVHHFLGMIPRLLAIVEVVVNDQLVVVRGTRRTCILYLFLLCSDVSPFLSLQLRIAIEPLRLGLCLSNCCLWWPGSLLIAVIHIILLPGGCHNLLWAPFSVLALSLKHVFHWALRQRRLWPGPPLSHALFRMAGHDRRGSWGCRCGPQLVRLSRLVLAIDWRQYLLGLIGSSDITVKLWFLRAQEAN